MPMRMTPVTGSSFISAIGYDPDREELTVTFKDGKSFTYDGVPDSVYHAFNDADSMGQFYHSNIKGNYDGRRG